MTAPCSYMLSVCYLENAPIPCILYSFACVQVVGTEGKVTATVMGACDYPHIDEQKLYPKRTKTRPDSAKVSKQFIISSGRFEFGPLLAGKDAAGYK